MTDREAQDLIRMAESNWHMDLGPARAMWRTELMMYDASTATRAMGHLAKRQSYKITLSDLVQTMEMMIRNAKDKEKEEANRLADERGLKEGRRGYATPEWVWIWSWCRWYRDPREDRFFPQQREVSDPQYTMNTTEYETLKQEWLDAGSPKKKIPGTLTA